MTSKSRASRGSARDKEKKPRTKIKQVCDRKAAKRKRCPATECGVWGSAPGASAAHSLRYFSGARNRVAFVAKADGKVQERLSNHVLPLTCPASLLDCLPGSTNSGFQIIGLFLKFRIDTFSTVCGALTFSYTRTASRFYS